MFSKHNHYHSTHRNAAFSLMEIMVVIIIIGLLAGAVSISTKHFIDKARYNRVKSDMQTIKIAINDFYGEHGRYPTNAEGLEAVKDAIESTITIDPWGNEYQYVQPGANDDYDIICYGADGEVGGDGINADITDDSLQEKQKPGQTTQ